MATAMMSELALPIAQQKNDKDVYSWPIYLIR